MTLQDKLKELMLRRGFKQNVLAEKAGICQSLAGVYELSILFPVKSGVPSSDFGRNPGI